MHSDERLWHFVDGELPPAEAAAIETEAETDDLLRQRIREFRSIKREVLAGAPQPPPDFADRVAHLAAGREPAPLIDLDEARGLLKRALVAAALAAAVGMGYLAFEILPKMMEPPPIHAAPDVFGR